MLSFTVKQMFFDREVVKRATRRAERQALSRAGAFIRTSARTSMRPRRASSKPGEPPSVHQGDLRRFIYFAYEPVLRSVVVGPVGFKSSVVPRVLERGGRVKGKVRVGGKVIATARGKQTTTGGRLVEGEVQIAPRPYMQPALEANLNQLPQMWRGSVTP